MEEAVSFSTLQEICLDMAALVFLVSGATKLLGREAFREGLLYIPYMPVWLTHAVAWVLPPLEVVVAAGLFLNALWAKAAALVMLAAFCGVTVIVLRKRLQVPCGCFQGFGNRSMSGQTLRDNVLLAAAIGVTGPLSSHDQLWASIPTAGFVVLFYLAAQHLRQQHVLVTDMRKQGVA
ncbi:MAG: hypothetical protein K2X38_19805 [Gemmataceae bacterium]|nr:hypothetical protein [Gemmataceae bacterium]